MTISRREAFQRMFDSEVGPAIGGYSTATGGTTSTLIDTARFNSTNKGASYYQGQIRIILPDRPAASRERDVGRYTGSTSTLALAGPALTSAIANGEYYVWLRRGLYWNQLTQAWLDALRPNSYQLTTPVSQVLRDGDLRGQESDAWVSSHADLTFSYSEASEWNNTGLQSLLLNFGGVLDTRYLTQSEGFYLKAGQQVYVAGIAIMGATGEANFSLWNDTTNLVASTVRTVTGKGSWHVWELFSAPTDGTYNIRLGGTAGTLMAWDAFPNHYLDALYWKTSSLFDQSWKLHRLDEIEYRQSLGANWEDAKSRTPRPWRRRIDFTTENLREEANPNGIQVLGRSSLPAHDLFYVGQGRASDNYIEGEQTTTRTDEEAVFAAFMVNACGLLEARDRLGPNGRWQALERRLRGELATHKAVNEEPAAAGQRHVQHFNFGRR